MDVYGLLKYLGEKVSEGKVVVVKLVVVVKGFFRFHVFMV